MSKKLADWAPPLNLCKQIPDDEFIDSALVWERHFGVYKENAPIVNTRKSALIQNILAPAPLLDEILEELAAGDEIFESFDPKILWNGYQGGWIITIRGQGALKEGILDRDILRETDRSRPTHAALKLWFKLKGIKYEN